MQSRATLSRFSPWRRNTEKSSAGKGVIIFQEMSQEEWLVFYRSQLVLKRHREISQVFVDGLVGKNFSKALSFYLDRSEEYLADMEKLGLTSNW